MIHYDAYLELARLQAQRGHSSSKHIDAAVASWFVSEPSSEVRRGLSEVGSRILRADVSVPLHPHVDVTWGDAALS